MNICRNMFRFLVVSGIDLTVKVQSANISSVFGIMDDGRNKNPRGEYYVSCFVCTLVGV